MKLRRLSMDSYCTEEVYRVDRIHPLIRLTTLKLANGKGRSRFVCLCRGWGQL